MRFLFLICIWLILTCPCIAEIITVDDDGPADFNNIQAGIDASSNGDEIEVAPGTYNEAIRFYGKSVRLYSNGGPGATTIDATDLYSSVVTCIDGEDANTILEGFTITGGNADHGGGMHNISSSPTVTNCIFIGNSTGTYGGGMFNMNCSPTVTNCTFIGNTAEHRSGGMENYYSSPIVTNCTFSNNTAAELGGGMCNQSSSPTVTNCKFSRNAAILNYGGGMYNNSNSNPTVTGCTFSGNSAELGGGMYNVSSSLTVTNCSFSGNTAEDFGGGMYNTGGSTTITNCIMWGDSSGISCDEIYNSSSTLSISYSDIEGSGGWNSGYGADGGGNIDADPLLFKPVSDDFHLQSQSGRLSMNLDLDEEPVFWAYDTVTSPCIDAGDPNMDVGNEPEGNGGRINMGYYGGTYQASKSSHIEAIEGDVNGDGKVDFLDFAIMAENWLEGV